MITVNETTQYQTVITNEAYKKIDNEWERMLIVSFPRKEYTLETATEIANGATNITVTSEYQTTTYYVSGINETKSDLYYYNFWMYCPDLVVSENLTSQISELEQSISTMSENMQQLDDTAIELYEANLNQEEINMAQDDALIELYEMIGG